MLTEQVKEGSDLDCGTGRPGQGRWAHGNSFRTKLIHPGEYHCERKTNSKSTGHTTQKLQKHWQEGLRRSLGSWAGALRKNEGWGYIFGSLQLTEGTRNWGCWRDHLGRREGSQHWALRQSSFEWPQRREGASKADKREGGQGMRPCWSPGGKDSLGSHLREMTVLGAKGAGAMGDLIGGVMCPRVQWELVQSGWEGRRGSQWRPAICQPGSKSGRRPSSRNFHRNTVPYSSTYLVFVMG